MIRHATKDDFKEVFEIILEAKELLSNLEINMWTGDYPNSDVILEDIENENAYVYEMDDKIVATFSIFFGEDPVYEKIENGEWLSNHPYSVIKRIAVSSDMRGQNIVGKIIEIIGLLSLSKGYPSMRLDTHPDNRSMKRAIEKNGYVSTGELNTDQTWHAYEKVLLNEPIRIIKAEIAHLPEMMQIIDDAKASLKHSGVDQWQTGYPDESVFERDIQHGNSYLFYEEDELVALFALIYGDDPTYQVIEEGEWQTDNPYSVIHRLAVAKDKLGTGVVGRVFENAAILTLLNGYDSIRVDTHPDNRNMQRALYKAGFHYCGHIFLEDDDLRLAYEKTLV